MKTAICLSLAAGLAAIALNSTSGAVTTVSTQPFDSVELKGGGHVSFSHGAVQQVRILKGSTVYTRIHADDSDSRKLDIETCNVDCPGHYHLDIEIVTPRIAGVAVSGGGAIELDGTFPPQHKISAAVEGGGTIDLRAMSAQNVTTAVEGGGNIRVQTNGTLMAAINGGGHVRYWGSPRVTEAINGGGSVSKGD